MNAAEAKANRIKKAELLRRMLELSNKQPDEEGLMRLLEERRQLIEEIARLDSEFDYAGQMDKATDQRIKELLEALITRDKELFSFAMRSLENMKKEITVQRRQLKRASMYRGAYSAESMYFDRKE